MSDGDDSAPSGDIASAYEPRIMAALNAAQQEHDRVELSTTKLKHVSNILRATARKLQATQKNKPTWRSQIFILNQRVVALERKKALQGFRRLPE